MQINTHQSKSCSKGCLNLKLLGFNLVFIQVRLPHILFPFLTNEVSEVKIFGTVSLFNTRHPYLVSS